MKLDLSVLEDVRKELETSQDITIRPILTKIRNAKKKQLSALNLLCACDDYATFDQIWAIEYVFNGEKNWTREILNKELQYFIEEGIIKSKEGIIKFAGDDFDKIYIKYFAREQRVRVNFPDFPLEIFWHIRMTSFLEKNEGLSSIGRFFVSDIDFDLNSIVTKMASESSVEDIFVESPPIIIEDLYFLMLSYQNEGTIPIVQIKVILPWLNVSRWYYAEKPKDPGPIDICIRNIESLKKRTNEVGGDFLVDKKELTIVPVEVLAKKIELTANERLRNSLADDHSIRMVEKYIEERNIEESLFHANLSYRYNPNPEPSVSNNLGYLFMVNGDLDRAKELLERAVNNYKEPCKAALPNYNLGILEAKYVNLNKSLERIELCIRQLENISEQERKCACLIIPNIINGELKYEEIKEPDLLEAANKAKSTLESFLKIEH
jgi:hypothetical protein